MKTYKIIAYMISVSLLLISLTGIVTIVRMVELQEVTEKIYNHPFLVSNAARTINSHFSHMKHDVIAAVLENDEVKILKLFERAEQHSIAGLHEFDIIFQRYLGKKNHVQNAHEAFLEWRSIRQEIKVLIVSGNKAEAISRLKTIGEQKSIAVTSAMEKLIRYAENKASEFRAEAKSKKENTQMLIGSLVFVIVFVSLFIGVYIVRRVYLAEKEIQQHFHVIDQNVCVFETDCSGIIFHASNALCRLLEISMNDIVNQKLPDIVNDLNSQLIIKSGLKLLQTGKPWDGNGLINNLDSGEVTWLEMNVSPVLDGDYKLKGYSGIVTDVSDKHAINEQAITDKLTGLFNRRHFDNIVPEEINIARRKNDYITLAIADIDYFKNYNDYYGHPLGDKVLEDVAEILTENLKRPNDYVFRIGGEEFALLFSGNATEQSFQLTEKIRLAVEAAGIRHNESSVSEYLTISIGFCTVKIDKNINANVLYNYADKALYVAKETRNKCVPYTKDLTTMSIVKNKTS